MQAVLVQVGQPETSWCHALGTRYPRLEVEVLSITSEPGRTCTETVLLSGPDLEAALQFLIDHPHVVDHRLLGRTSGSAQIRLHLGPCKAADVISLTGVAPRLPFRARRGADIWFLIGPQPVLEETFDRLEGDGIPHRILRDSSWSGVTNRLTENQRRVLAAAADAGYYDYPRKITLSGLAQRLGVAKSTLSEALMVIEKKIMVQFSDETRNEDGDERESVGTARSANS